MTQKEFSMIADALKHYKANVINIMPYLKEEKKQEDYELATQLEKKYRELAHEAFLNEYYTHHRKERSTKTINIKKGVN